MPFAAIRMVLGVAAVSDRPIVMFPGGAHHDRIASAEVLSLGLLCVGVVGLILLRLIGKRSAARRLHGQYVLGWMTVGWIVGSCVGVYLIGFPGYLSGEADTGCAGAALLVGWAIGMVHGAIALRRRRQLAT